MNTAMKICIALLRSVLINGQRVKSAELKAMAEEAGCADVRTVIATGNLVFRSRLTAGSLAHALEQACERRYGRATEVVVKSAAQWRTLVAANPFPDESARAPSRVLAWAMRSPLPDAGLAQLRQRTQGEERVERTAEGDLYMWFGEGGISESRLPSGFALKALGAVGTNRNWNTVGKISAVLDALEGVG